MRMVSFFPCHYTMKCMYIQFIMTAKELSISFNSVIQVLCTAGHLSVYKQHYVN